MVKKNFIKMKNKTFPKVICDGNEAVALIAHKTNEVCAIYPITPSSPMAEHADEWSAQKIANIWGNIPDVIEMQSEGGAAGTAHGALQTGALLGAFGVAQHAGAVFAATGHTASHAHAGGDHRGSYFRRCDQAPGPALFRQPPFL